MNNIKRLEEMIKEKTDINELLNQLGEVLKDYQSLIDKIDDLENRNKSLDKLIERKDARSRALKDLLTGVMEYF